MNIVFATASQLAQMIRDKKISAVEVLYQILLSKPTYNLQVKNTTLHTKFAYPD